MRRIATILLALYFLASPGCQTASNAVRDAVFGSLAEKHDTSRHPSERRAAYNRHIDEHIDR